MRSAGRWCRRPAEARGHGPRGTGGRSLRSSSLTPGVPLPPSSLCVRARAAGWGAISTRGFRRKYRELMSIGGGKRR